MQFLYSYCSNPFYRAKQYISHLLRHKYINEILYSDKLRLYRTYTFYDTRVSQYCRYASGAVFTSVVTSTGFNSGFVINDLNCVITFGALTLIYAPGLIFSG